MAIEDAAHLAERARELVAALSVEEKATLCSGQGFWSTQPIERVGIPKVEVRDGPHGVRMQVGDVDHLGLRGSEPATCFPTASALAATWDRELVSEVGAAVADECLEFGIGVLLGPGVNLKRSPRCGRNFEYLSEDPLLAGELAATFIEAVQGKGIGTSLKHFAANHQETRRMTIDVVADERTLRELELSAFETPVRRAQPWTVMGAYNRVGGTYACENPWLLTDVLKGEWGHTGIVVTDWGAMNDRVPALAAGCELQMPGSADDADASIAEAVRDGRLDEAVLDAAAVRLVEMALRAEANLQPEARFDRDEHHRLARRVAADAVVLCRNVDTALPIGDDDTVALVGAFAEQPRYQGTGSSRVNPTKLETLREELTSLVGDDRLTYAPGYDSAERTDDDLVAAAVEAARGADVAVVAVGLPDGYENEGDDRPHLRLPPTHDGLIAALAAEHDRVVVVLSNGAPVEMPWVDDVQAIVEGYLGGQAGGGGLADVLTGRVNPSGHLAETFPRHLDDVPSSRNVPGGTNTVEYREGLYVGYRFHDTVDGDVLFPFGHGLSYSTFALGDVEVDRAELAAEDLDDGGEVTVSVQVTNTGDLAGKTVVQLYVRDVEAAVYRPDRELKGFAKVALEPGASTRVTVPLGHRAFAYWHPDEQDWVVEPGRFEILVGASSRDLRGSVDVEVTGDPLPQRDEPEVYRRPPRYLDVTAASFTELLGRPLPPNPGFVKPYDRNTPIGATATSPQGKALVAAVRRRMRSSFGEGQEHEALVRSLVEEAPLRTLTMGGDLRDSELDAIIDLLNGRFVLGGDRLVRSLWQRRSTN